MSMPQSLKPLEIEVQKKIEQWCRLAALLKDGNFDEDSPHPNNGIPEHDNPPQIIEVSSDHLEDSEDDIILTSPERIPPSSLSSPPTTCQTSFRASPSLVEAPEKFSAQPQFQWSFGRPNASYSRSRRERAKHPARTPTRSMSYGSTQEFSQAFRDEHVSPSKSREVKFREAQVRLDEVNSDETQRTTSGERTYTTNGTGHIDLRTVSGQNAMTLEEEDDDMNELEEEDDIDAETQTYGITGTQFPDDQRFKTPKTPASRGKKRARNGDVLSDPGSTPRTTPRLPVNPFGGGQAINPGLMSLSQVFGATQAQSSPALNISTSEDSARPSPNYANFGRPASAPGSSPVLLIKTPHTQPEGGPYEQYESIRDSQKRRKKIDALDMASDALDMEDGDGNDLIDQLSSQERADILAQRRRERERMSEETRRTFSSITATRPAPPGKGRGKGRLGRPNHNQEDKEPRPRSSPAVERSSLTFTPPVSKLNLCKGSEDVSKATGDIGDSQKTDDGEDEESEPDELGMEGSRLVQVPRTISKRRQIKVLDPADARPQSPLEVQEAAHQTVDVANSPPTGNRQRPLPQESSNGPIVPQSQVPDSTAAVQQSNTQSAFSQVKALAAIPQSQQTATPPSSSASPKRQSASRRKQNSDILRARRNETSITSNTASKQLSGDELTSPDLPATIPETHSVDEIIADESTSSSPEPQTVAPVAQKTQLRRPKKISEILSQSQESPLDLLGDDIFEPFKEMAEDHSRFQAALGTTPDGSPPAPGRKRARCPLAPSKEVPTLNAASISSPILRSSQAETGDTAFHSARDARDETPAMRPRELLVTTPGQSSSEKENEPTPRRKKVAGDARPDLEASPKRTQQQIPPSSTVSEPVLAPGRKRARTGSLMHRRREIDEVSLDNGIDAERPSTPSEQAPFPSMVWALFSGSPPGYFPARCLGPVENNKLRVRFEDGNECSIPSNSVRRLEVHVGDTVKVDTRETKTNTYVVLELAEKQTCGPPPTQIQTFSDIHGWTKVRLGLKTKNGPVMPQEELVSYPLLYLTQTLFNGLKDRVYQHPVPEGSTRSQSPSISQSMPTTPSSKQLRASTTMKKQSGLRQSLNVSMNQYGLFSGMAFAITAVEQKKRLNLQGVIERNGGGLILDGFDDMFDGSHKSHSKSKDSESVPLELDSSSKTIGFTALLTDRHCRTTTYLHALALNIPCLSVCWVKDCIAKSQLLDWSPYLLASGESAVLDGAVRSRTMAIPPSYSSPTSATQWPLASMFASRRKFMEGANVLITCLEKKQMHGHAFIAYALGAVRVALASTHEESQKLIKDGKWDWICSADELEAQKGRKRKSGAGDSTGDLDIQLKKGMRVVKPEFVVQSLVLGRLVTE